MSKGIVASKPSSSPSGNGRLIASDTSAGPTGGEIYPGTDIPYKEDIKANDGDSVEFKVDGGAAQGITFLSAGTVITGDYSENIVVNKGEFVLITRAKCEGKITLNGGTLTMIDGSTFFGKIESKTADSTLLLDTVSIEGKIDFNCAGNLSIKNSKVDGKVASNGNNYASVTGCTIQGTLEVLNAKLCQCSGNTVEGTVNTPGCKE